ncbi:MAG: MBL fold metallo-hydrolase [Bacteroidales bacterium]|jgi:glyoxylase-like metal-dependent hydrolase (beta-lactamase superfamily II)|nr:MBL fold metallo-hydrolase [Bacteroidales bacterium]
MNIQTFVFNHFGENTFVVSDPSSRKCAIIDPGCFFEKEKQELKTYILSENLQVEYILFTHCHLDHAFGAKFAAETFPHAQIAAHKNEEVFINDALNQSLRFGINMEQPPHLTHYIEDGEVISIGNIALQAIFVPGHSPGGLCFYSVADSVLFAGDVLFSGSVGRSDLLGGNHSTLIAGIEEKLLTLPGKTVVYCGHGPATTIETERNSNPYL